MIVQKEKIEREEELFRKEILEWESYDTGGNFHLFFKEFETKDGEKAMIEISNVVPSAWFLRKSRRKSGLLDKEGFDLLLRLGKEIEHMELERLALELKSDDSEAAHFRCSEEAAKLFHRETLEKVAELAAFLRETPLKRIFG